MSEKGRNTVPCVDGIPNVVTWPTPGKEVEVNRTVLKNVAAQLREDYNKLNSGGAGTASDIKSTCGNLDAAHFGTFTAAQGILGSNRTASTTISDTQTALLKAYEQVIEAIEQAAKGYRDADDNTKQNADRIAPTSF